MNRMPTGTPFSEEVRLVLVAAFVEAREDEEYWQEQGKPHLRTFLKTTPLGLAILALARKVNEEVTA